MVQCRSQGSGLVPHEERGPPSFYRVDGTQYLKESETCLNRWGLKFLE